MSDNYRTNYFAIGREVVITLPNGIKLTRLVIVKEGLSRAEVNQSWPSNHQVYSVFIEGAVEPKVKAYRLLNQAKEPTKHRRK